MSKLLLTVDAVKALPLPEKGSKPVTYRDERTPGLELDCAPTMKNRKKPERKTYFYRRKIGNKRPRTKLGTSASLTPEQARQRCATIARTDTISGEIVNRRNLNVTFNVKQMLEWYLETRDPNTTALCVNGEKKMRPGTLRNAWYSVNNYLEPYFGKWDVAEITNRDLIFWYEKLTNAGKKLTPIQKALSLLRKAFYAARRVHRIDENLSFPDFIVHLDQKPRTSKFSASEFRRLWRFLPFDEQFCYTSEAKAYELQRAARLLMLTGARKMEIIQARWCEMQNSLSGRAPSLVVSPERQKKGRPHHILLSTQAQQILQEQHTATKPASRDDYIFEHIRGQMCINRSLKDQGGFVNTAHDIRRTVATCWGALSYDDKLIERCLGHLPKGTTQKNYNQHEYLEARFAMMQDWANILMKTINTITNQDESSMWGATDCIVEALNVGEHRDTFNIQNPTLRLIRSPSEDSGAMGESRKIS
tara:strand:- start:1827 stop:3254 length:1428 start_codon:yes stop_codon:yes gene_type:complete